MFQNIPISLTAKRNSLRNPGSVAIANSSSRTQELESSITRISSYGSRTHGTRAKFHRTVGGSSGKSTAYRCFWKKETESFTFFHSQEKDVVNIINLFCDKDTIYLFLIVIVVQKGHFPTNVFIYLQR